MKDSYRAIYNKGMLEWIDEKPENDYFKAIIILVDSNEEKDIQQEINKTKDV